MPVYHTHGPHVVPTYNGRAAKVIDSAELRQFWEECADLAERCGCYVFAIRAGAGTTPIYVGKATRTFRQEAFAPHKLEKYQRALADYKSGTPVLFLLAAPRGRGATNLKATAELENFLIQTAVARNPNLLNVRGTKRADWSIAGVIRRGVGTPSAAAKQLKTTLGV